MAEDSASAEADGLGVFSRGQRDNLGGSAGTDTADESLTAFREEERRYFESAGLGARTILPSTS